MKTNFNVTGSERKRLVQTISKSCGEDSRYLGAPSMAYEVGPFTVSRDGTLEFSDSIDSEIVEKLYEDIASAGFTFEAPETAEIPDTGLQILLPLEGFDQDSLDRLAQGRTTITIAHRLSTIREADIILVMKDGNIIEQGSHDELIALGGFYNQLYNSQFAAAG